MLHLGEREVLVVACDPPVEVALSAAERAVAQLAIEGASNAVIARRRGTSERTVANQLARLYRKLGVGSRAELAARGLPPAGSEPEERSGR